MDNLISVILPVYNGGLYLSDSIESILKQTFIDFEFIIINDGSTDDSLELIKKYASNDNRIKVINRENRGLIYTLNEGIEQAKGNYIARMDQDDIALKTRLEFQYKYMIDNHLDVCGGNYIVIDENNNSMNLYRLFQNEFEILLTLASNVPFAHPCVMIKKEFLESNKLEYGINGYRNAEDLDLWINMYNRGAKFGNLDETILKYRILSTSMSRVNHKIIMKETNNQIDVFIKKNRKNFKQAFGQFFAKEVNSKELQRVAVKAALRYSLINFDFSILSKCFKKVSITNLFIGALSFIKLKWLYYEHRGTGNKM